MRRNVMITAKPAPYRAAGDRRTDAVEASVTGEGIYMAGEQVRPARDMASQRNKVARKRVRPGDWYGQGNNTTIDSA
jgi:hypothetical protein